MLYIYLYFVINKNLKGYIYDVEYYLNGDDFIKVMVTNPSEVVSIDLKEFQKKEPVAYAELLEDYPKVTKRSESLRITLK